MYESPIEILAGVTNHVMRETEDGIVCEVRKQLGVNIDKEELTKALQYDRHQYERGYADGKNHSSEWIPLTWDESKCNSDFPDDMDGSWAIFTDGKNMSIERAKKDVYDRFFPSGRWFEMSDAIAWMPLPAKYERGEDSCFT